MKRQHVLIPQEINRVGNIDSIRNVDFAKVPTYYYDWTRFEMPLTDAEFDSEFGTTRTVFNLETDPPCERQTNTAVGSSINEAFLALGVGIVAIGESEAFSVHGARVDRPLVARDTPQVGYSSGVVANALLVNMQGVAQAENPRDATLWWGAPTWRFIEKFFQAYRLQVLLNHRFQVVDESLLNVGMSPLPAEFIGASDSYVPSMPFVRAVNDVMAAKAIAHVFVPPNSAEADEVGEAENGFDAPTVGITYGHPRICGLANRLYPFTQPLLFTPGMQFEMAFQRVEDEVCYRALRSSATVTTQTADVTLNANIGTVNAPLTTVAGAPAVIPGGSVSIGLVLKGYALWPGACIDYLANHLIYGSKSAAMYGNNAYLAGLLQEQKYASRDPGGKLGKIVEAP